MPYRAVTRRIRESSRQVPRGRILAPVTGRMKPEQPPLFAESRPTGQNPGGRGGRKSRVKKRRLPWVLCGPSMWDSFSQEVAESNGVDG